MARRIAQAVALAVVSSTTMAQEKSPGSDRTLLSRRTYEVKEDFGAVGDGKNDDTTNIQKAFDKLKEGNSDLHFKKGKYLCSNLELENVKNSKITFDKGAEMFVLKKLSHWQTSSQSGKYMSWWNIHDCEQLTIQGGTWNGDYDWWASQVPKKDKSPDGEGWRGHNPRPQMISFNAKGFTATDITINNAMGVHMKGGGSDINLSNLKFRTRHNTDNTGGIMLCQVDGATVSHVDAQVNDDCLKVCDHAHDVTFEHSTCTYGHGLTIGGHDSKLDIDNCTWRDIDVIAGRHGPRIKWTSEAKGQIKNVLYEDIRMYNVQIPIVAESEYGHTSGRTEDTFHLGSITFKDITATVDKNKGGYDEYNKIHDLGFHCDSKASCKDIHLQNVHIDDPKAEWVCESCGGDMDSNVSPDASKYFDDKSSESDLIQSTLSGLCLDLPGGDTSNGAYLWMWDCYGGEGQQWSFQDDKLVYAANPSKCVDLLGWDTTNGNALGLWDCYDAPYQQWGFDSVGGTIYLYNSAHDATKCIRIGGEDRGASVEIWDCDWNDQMQTFAVGGSKLGDPQPALMV